MWDVHQFTLPRLPRTGHAIATGGGGVFTKSPLRGSTRAYLEPWVRKLLAQRVNSEGDFKTDVRQRHSFGLVKTWGWLGRNRGKGPVTG